MRIVGTLQAARLVLESGEAVQCRPHGHSMEPKIKSGALVTIEPLSGHQLEKGDIVLAKVNGQLYLHLVSGFKHGRVQISNNKGHVNGWASKVFGIVTGIEKD